MSVCLMRSPGVNAPTPRPSSPSGVTSTSSSWRSASRDGTGRPPSPLCVGAELVANPAAPAATASRTTSAIRASSSSVAALVPRVAHHEQPHRGVPDVRGVVEDGAVPLDRVEVLGERLEVPRDPGLERREAHVLDVLERAPDEAAVLRSARRDREPAVAGDDAGDAVPRRRRERGIPEDLRVVVGVDVDEPGATTCPAASSSRRPLSPSPISLIVSPLIATSARRPGAPVPSTTVPPRITKSFIVSSFLRARNIPLFRRLTLVPGGHRSRSTLGTLAAWRRSCISMPSTS